MQSLCHKRIVLVMETESASEILIRKYQSTGRHITEYWIHRGMEIWFLKLVKQASPEAHTERTKMLIKAHNAN
jgi:hypothetical protein